MIKEFEWVLCKFPIPLPCIPKSLILFFITSFFLYPQKLQERNREIIREGEAREEDGIRIISSLNLQHTLSPTPTLSSSTPFTPPLHVDLLQHHLLPKPLAHSPSYPTLSSSTPLTPPPPTPPCRAAAAAGFSSSYRNRGGGEVKGVPWCGISRWRRGGMGDPSGCVWLLGLASNLNHLPLKF